MTMSKRTEIYIITSLCIALIAVIAVILCTVQMRKHHQKEAYYTFEQLQHRGAIRIGVFHNYTDYFLYHGKASGLQYNMSHKMAEHYHMQAYYIVFDSYRDACMALMQNKVDMLAVGFDNAMADNAMLALTLPYATTRQVLVQRKHHHCINADNFPDLQPVSADSTYKMLLLRDMYCTHPSLALLSHLSAASWHLVSVYQGGYGRMFALLDSGYADAMVCNAHVVAAYMPQQHKLDTLHLPGTTQSMRWAVRRDNTSLLDSVNTWLDSYVHSRAYKALCKKTHYQTGQIKYRKNLRNTRISGVDYLFKRYAKRYNIDWRFVAALAYRESHFNPNAEGAGGAAGIMQMMPETAAHLGHDSLQSADVQIMAGCKLISRLVKRFKAANVHNEDLYFYVAAAYNAGHGNIEEAMRMAETMHLNPRSWRDVEKAMISMGDAKLMKQYHHRCFYKGKFTVHYTHEVMMSYMHYINMIDIE